MSMRSRTRRSSDGIPDATPVVPAVLAAIAAALFALPLAGLVWRAPWSSAWDTLNTPAARDALRLSLVTSLSATGIAIVLGVPATRQRIVRLLAQAERRLELLIRLRPAWAYLEAFQNYFAATAAPLSGTAADVAA